MRKILITQSLRERHKTHVQEIVYTLNIKKIDLGIEHTHENLFLYKN